MTTTTIAIVVSKFNEEISQMLLENTLQTLQDSKDKPQTITTWVPGAFEIPLVAARFAARSDISAVICLGCIIRGETSNFDHIAAAITSQICRIGVDSGTPVIFGVLTTDTREQALTRARPSGRNKGRYFANAALEMCRKIECAT